MMTDPIGDMLTRIRNANLIRRESVEMPASKIKVSIAKILEEQGYIRGYKCVEDNKQGMIRIIMKYTPRGERVIHTLRRVSLPGRRLYRKADDIEKTCGGMGISIISTSSGLMTGLEAKKKNVGGEILCEIW